ncbi:glycosyl transferase family 2 [Stanieria sp. NIES-3757]|nr:glycosyl transferase family 2 [Stanieria sp. NIES-3757]
MIQPIISIIIPVFNEAAIIQTAIERLKDNQDIEVIIVDGGSQDRTVELVLAMGVSFAERGRWGDGENKLKLIIASEPGRAYQMNAGAAIAKGDILLFLHADTQLPADYQSLIHKTLSSSPVIAGAFELAINSQAQSFRLVETMVNLRSRLFSLPYGDQAIFLKKSTFEKIGGYRNLAIMEDFELIQRLKCHGKIAIAPAAVLTSPRRWQKLGVGQTTAINQLIILGYYLGISPTKLRNFYRQVGRNKKF